MKIPVSLLAVFIASLVIVSCSDAAEGESTLGATEQQILQTLKAARPELEFRDIRPSPVPGYYHVAVGSEVLYVSEDGSHFFLGYLFDVEPGRFVNSTEVERASSRMDDLARLDPDSLIVFAPEGETRGVLRVFTDVTCGFCRKLHEEIADFTALGIEIQYLAYPRSGIERNGVYTHEFRETVKAWCAEEEDRQEVMTRLKLGQSLPGEVCSENPVAEHYALGRQFGVTGTPAILMPDGTLVPGYRSAADFARLLGISD
jgi:thiol:disulfide interchange protein DsbC